MPQMFFDVETTGLPPRCSNPRNFELFSQCRVVSIAWTLRDAETIYSQKYFVVDPDIEDEEIGASFIHGITRGVVDRYGKTTSHVMDSFMDDLSLSDLLVAHNMDFDKNVVLAELYKLGRNDDAKLLSSFESLCTMKTTTEVVGIRNKNKSGYKWPKLSELHEFLFDTGFENAHHAMCDVDALVKCFYEIRTRSMQ